MPHGSVLGPLLFLLYINDIVCDILVHINHFANECVLYSKINTKSDHLFLNSARQKAACWCQEWQMAINVEKV